mmetsp:Transcript_61735/g.123764  ORF Transcript_61735/g.123764 Transcript_61735/m.123764 type:complete len:124 (-) Transcript_61735:157-528(-)
MGFVSATIRVQRLMSICLFLAVGIELVTAPTLPVAGTMGVLGVITFLLAHWPLLSMFVVCTFLPLAFARAMSPAQGWQAAGAASALAALSFIMQACVICIFDVEDGEDGEGKKSNKNGKQKTT